MSSTSKTAGDDEASTWRKRFAAQANNLAWDLAERMQRSAPEDDALLSAASAAWHLWEPIGTPNQLGHAALLVAHAHGLLRSAGPAKRWLERADASFAELSLDPWERALVEAVRANVAAACGEELAHARHLRAAERLTAELAQPQEREILAATLQVLPRPKG